MADLPGSSFQEKLEYAIKSEVAKVSYRSRLTNGFQSYVSEYTPASDAIKPSKYPLTHQQPSANPKFSNSFTSEETSKFSTPYATLTRSNKRKHINPESEASRTKMNDQGPSLSVEQETETTKSLERRRLSPLMHSSRRRSQYETVGPIETPTRHPSNWYENIDMKQKFSRSELESLKYLHSLIRRCTVDIDGSSHTAGEAVMELRNKIHQVQFYDFLSGVLIRKSKLLEDNGLPRIFKAKCNIFPWDIQADSHALYQRWSIGKIDPYLLIGIDMKLMKNASGKELKTRSLQRDYLGKMSCNYVGEGTLVNGQWWPLQICALRDGAHGEIEAGIHGQVGKGAFSIVLSNGGYADIDEGDSIQYCGTLGTYGKPTISTTHLIDSFKAGAPIRVLRSAALHAKNMFKPKRGLRYDGLYQIIDYSVLDQESAMYQFKMTRCEGQHPLRHKGVEARPTEEELIEYSKVRKLLGLNP